MLSQKRKARRAIVSGYLEEKKLDRDFGTISPSAKSIILMRGYTSIPYAKETAELVSYPDSFILDYEKKDFLFWARVMHFEARYLSINQLTDDLSINNYLEISSGYSFRCLEKSKAEDIFYIDTDLPELIAKKKEMLGKLSRNEGLGRVLLKPLNALDEKQFRETISIFPPGKVAIVNEGLLVYLDKLEKEKLCRIIHSVLKERGGCWITSDIYVRAMVQGGIQKTDMALEDFRARHNIEENKFSSFEEAKEFFADNGFAIEKEESIDITQLSSFNFLARSLRGNAGERPPKATKMNTTWRLVIAK